jgi:hypothetical protein
VEFLLCGSNTVASVGYWYSNTNTTIQSKERYDTEKTIILFHSTEARQISLLSIFSHLNCFSINSVATIISRNHPAPLIVFVKKQGTNPQQLCLYGKIYSKMMDSYIPYEEDDDEPRVEVAADGAIVLERVLKKSIASY